MSEHISQKCRKILDMPLSKKNYVFWIFSPLLFCISFINAAVAWIRRRKNYIPFSNFCIDMPDSLQVICIGNILMGGTGKSPLVRAFAESHLRNHAIIAIAARGISAIPTSIDSKKFTKDDLNKLSDENREHFEILRHKFQNEQFFIFQNKNRKKSLLNFISIISHIQNKKSIFILDDGLQHFACPRHVNICVCDDTLHRSAPPYAFPIGPYREGFGRNSIQTLLSHFDSCIWTNRAQSPGLLHNPILRFTSTRPTHEVRNFQNFPVSYLLKFVQFHVSEDAFTFEFLPENNILLQNHKFDKPLIIAGIAHPERFVRDLKNISEQFERSDTIFLADHGSLNQKCIDKILKSNTLIFTLKDFFRFCANKYFLKLCHTRTVYGCYVEYNISDFKL